MHKKSIMACITAQPHCVEIVNSALKLSKQLEVPLSVVTALPVKDSAEGRAIALKCLNKISEECGVNITIIYSDNPPLSLANEAIERKPIHIFIGEDSGFLKSFRRIYNASPISIVASGVICTIPAEYEITQKIVG